MATRELSQEQLALAKARKEKNKNKVVVTKANGPELLSRRWLPLPCTPNLGHAKQSRYQQVKIMTWNVCRLVSSYYLIVLC